MAIEKMSASAFKSITQKVACQKKLSTAMSQLAFVVKTCNMICMFEMHPKNTILISNDTLHFLQFD